MESRHVQSGIDLERQDARSLKVALYSDTGTMMAGGQRVSQEDLSMNRASVSIETTHRLSTDISEHLPSAGPHPSGKQQPHTSVSLLSAAPVLWLTGLPAAGKSTIAGLTAQRLAAEGIPSEVLDGDEVRKAISPTLGFSREERALQALRLAWIAEMLSRHGVVPIVAAITPYRSDREAAARLLGNRFTEVWVHADAAVCRTRDPKGLWLRCELGEISGVTGFDSPYEVPLAASMKLETEVCSASSCASKLVDFVFSSRGGELPNNC